MEKLERKYSSRLCNCGCGGLIAIGNRYIQWRHRREKVILKWRGMVI